MQLSKLYSKIFPLQITKRVYIFIMLITIIPTIILTLIIPVNFFKLSKAEQNNELFVVVDTLDSQLKGSFLDILEKQGALHKPAPEQIKILKSVLQPRVQNVYKNFPGLSMGYYSKEFNCILAGSPSNNFFNLTKVPHDKPAFNVYKTGRAQFGQVNNTPIWNGKPSLYYVRPIQRNGKIIGHIWANVKLENIYFGVIKRTGLIFFIWAILVVIFLLSSYRFSTRIKTDLKDFANAAINNNTFSNTLLPELTPILELINMHTLELEKEIKERRFAEKSLEIERQRLFALLDRLPGLVWLQASDYSIRFANLNYRNIFGDPAGRPCYEIQQAGTNPCSKCPTRQVFQTGIPNNLEKLTFHEKEYEIYANPFTDVDGSSLVLKVGIDVSERKRAEQEVVRLHSLNIAGEIAAGIAHEIRNPMTTVRGFLQILGDKREFKEFKEYYELMIGELDKANAIISEFLSLAKNAHVVFKENNISKIVQALYPLLCVDVLSFDKNILTDLHDTVDFSSNENELRQLIINLTRNGLEAMSEGGTLTIKTFMDGSDVVLVIQDEGTGIKKEIQEKLGTPFVTTKEKGTGLGLAVCYSIAARHNAAINFETSTKGTTFNVRFKTDA